MGQQRGGGPVTGQGLVASRASRTGLAGAAIGVAVISVLAGCSSSGGNAGASSTPAAQATATTGPASALSTPSVTAAAAFAPIVEPFDPGHPARTRPAPASCDGQPTTLAIEQCYEAKIENADAAIDAVQLARYRSGSQTQRAAITTGDSAWLAARHPVCAKAFHGGGTIDEVDTAGCLLDESTARLDAVKGMTPPEAVLKSTDSTDPSALSWYTTPQGSRIATIDTQGDSTGGVIISWVIIGGADGFWSTRPSSPTWTSHSPTPGKSSPPTRPGTGCHRAPSTSSASTTAISPPTRTPVSAQEAGSTRRAPR